MLTKTEGLGESGESALPPRLVTLLWAKAQALAFYICQWGIAATISTMALTGDSLPNHPLKCTTVWNLDFFFLICSFCYMYIQSKTSEV